MGSADTGARERLVERLLDAAVERWHETRPVRGELALYEWLGLTRDEYRVFVEDGAAALAAGVGVPPEAAVALPETVKPVMVRLRVNSIAWHRRFHEGRWQECAEPSCVKDQEALAGVGEARPAEPGYISTAQKVVELQAECSRLREQLDAALNVVLNYHGWLERVEMHRTLGGYMGLDHAAGENVEGCSGCAALGVVGPPTNQGSAPTENVGRAPDGDTKP